MIYKCSLMWKRNWDRTPLYEQSMDPLTSHRILYERGLWDEAYGFSFIFEKTRKSNCLQMALPRQDFFLSYLKTGWKLEPAAFRSVLIGAYPTKSTGQRCASHFLVPWRPQRKFLLKLWFLKRQFMTDPGPVRTFWTPRIFFTLIRFQKDAVLLSD